MNTTITEIKNTPEGTSSRITEAEEWISELEDRLVEITAVGKNSYEVFMMFSAVSLVTPWLKSIAQQSWLAPITPTSRTHLLFFIPNDLPPSTLPYGEGNGNPLQCSCLENPRDGGAWWASVYGVAQSWTRLKQLSSSSSSNTTLTLSLHLWTLCLEKHPSKVSPHLRNGAPSISSKKILCLYYGLPNHCRQWL